MRSQPPCKIWAEKLALRREDLSPADRAALAAHLQACPACTAVWEDYRFLDSQLRALPLPALKPVPRLSFPNPGQEEENEDTGEIVKAGGRFLFPDRNILPLALIARLILAVLLLFGMQSASNNSSRSPGTTLFTYDGHSIFHGHSGYVDAVSWSPDGQFIASGSWDGTVQVWNVRMGALLTTYKRHKNVVSTLAWSPNGQYIASGSWDHTVQVWDAFSGALQTLYTGHSDVVSALAWSPDGQFIASGDRNDTVQVWNFLTGKVLHVYPPLYLGGIIEALAWSPNGQYIAAGDSDGTVHVLDTRKDSLLLIYKGYVNQVNALTWSPNSRYIASGSYDGTVQVWNADTGATLYTYRGHSNTVAALAWSPDGRYIASGSWDRTVQIWAAPCCN